MSSISNIYASVHNDQFMGQFYWDVEGLTNFVSTLFAAPQGSLARQVADDWAELLVTLNVSKLYNTPDYLDYDNNEINQVMTKKQMINEIASHVNGNPNQMTNAINRAVVEHTKESLPLMHFQF